MLLPLNIGVPCTISHHPRTGIRFKVRSTGGSRGADSMQIRFLISEGWISQNYKSREVVDFKQHPGWLAANNMSMTDGNKTKVDIQKKTQIPGQAFDSG